MKECKQVSVPVDYDGARLDKVLELLLPETGLRFRRRLCDQRKVLVDDAPRRPGYKVRQNQVIIVREEGSTVSATELGVNVVVQQEDFAAIYKPGGVHSATVAGGDANAAETVLPDLFSDASPVLLNRLDQLTSGLLLVGLNSQGVDHYHACEDSGTLRKYYLALVHGRFDGNATLMNPLDTDNRKLTRVLEGREPDERRWTDVATVAHDHEADTTLVRCLITKGARHQIRAHLAHAGFPIVGDPLYGEGDGDTLYLHHEKVELPGFEAQCDAPWSTSS